jgi:hypothetical protein
MALELKILTNLKIKNIIFIYFQPWVITTVLDIMGDQNRMEIKIGTASYRYDTKTRAFEQHNADDSMKEAQVSLETEAENGVKFRFSNLDQLREIPKQFTNIRSLLRWEHTRPPAAVQLGFTNMDSTHLLVVGTQQLRKSGGDEKIDMNAPYNVRAAKFRIIDMEKADENCNHHEKCDCKTTFQLAVDKNTLLKIPEKMTRLENIITTLELYKDNIALLTYLVAITPEAMDATSNPVLQDMKDRKSPPMNLGSLSEESMVFLTSALQAKITTSPERGAQLKHIYRVYSNHFQMTTPSAMTYSYESMLICVFSNIYFLANTMINIALNKTETPIPNLWNILLHSIVMSNNPRGYLTVSESADGQPKKRPATLMLNDESGMAETDESFKTQESNTVTVNIPSGTTPAKRGGYRRGMMMAMQKAAAE